MAFNSVSGDLTLAGGTLRQLAVKTVSGQVTADIELGADSRLKVNTVSGDVAVRVPASASARVDLKSASGRVRSSFEQMSASPGSGPAVLTATIGSGSAHVSLVSMTGDVTLLARDDAPPSGSASGSPSGSASGSATGEGQEPAGSAAAGQGDQR
jgi:DUF4097 and DUF4098 domain-containing protein YvlB